MEKSKEAKAVTFFNFLVAIFCKVSSLSIIVQAFARVPIVVPKEPGHCRGVCILSGVAVCLCACVFPSLVDLSAVQFGNSVGVKQVPR